MIRARLVASLLAGSLLAAAGPAAASVIGVGSLGALGANDQLDWSAFGGNGTVINTPESRLSPGGHTVGVHASDGVLQVRVEGVSHTGGFAPGSFLLTHDGTDDRMGATFEDQPVRGVGFHIEPLYLGAFTAYLSAYDASNTLLGIVSVSGTTSATSDGSAPFLGILSDSFDITRVSILVSEPPSSVYDFGANLAIDRAYFVEPAAAVPEPASLVVLGGALAALGLARRRKR